MNEEVEGGFGALLGFFGVVGFDEDETDKKLGVLG